MSRVNSKIVGPLVFGVRPSRVCHKNTCFKSISFTTPRFVGYGAVENTKETEIRNRVKIDNVDQILI